MRRAVADWSAGALALIVLAFGGLIVVKPAIDHWGDLYRANPFETATTKERVDRDGKGKRSETTITRTQASDSFVDRGLGDSGLLLLRIALAALAAFLAAAVLHRALLGSYGLRPGGRAANAAPRSPEPQAAAPASNGHQRSAVAARNGVNRSDEESGGNLGPVIARLVAVRREELGLSQRELAKRAGISHTVVSRIESGDYSPGRKTLDRLTEALDVRP